MRLREKIISKRYLKRGGEEEEKGREGPGGGKKRKGAACGFPIRAYNDVVEERRRRAKAGC